MWLVHSLATNCHNVSRSSVIILAIFPAQENAILMYLQHLTHYCMVSNVPRKVLKINGMSIYILQVSLKPSLNLISINVYSLLCCSHLCFLDLTLAQFLICYAHGPLKSSWRRRKYFETYSTCKLVIIKIQTVRFSIHLPLFFNLCSPKGILYWGELHHLNEGWHT